MHLFLLITHSHVHNLTLDHVHQYRGLFIHVYQTLTYILFVFLNIDMYLIYIY